MKNNEKLFDEIGMVDDRHVPLLFKEKKKKAKIITAIAGTTAAAAAVCFIAAGGAGFGKAPWEKYRIYPVFDYKNQRTVYDRPPQIPYTRDNTVIYWTEPFEALEYLFGEDEARQRLSLNPWNEEKLPEKLPVFKNKFFDGYDPNMSGFLSEEELTAMLENTAASLGLSLEPPLPYYDDFCELPLWVSAYSTEEKYGVGLIHITAYGNGMIRITFEPTEEGKVCSIPEITEGDNDENTRVLAEKFRNLIQYENPSLKLRKESLNWTDGSYEYVFYNSHKDTVQNMLNYGLANISFRFKENNVLSSINIENGFLGAEYIGDYPIISLEKAEELLESGSYIKIFPDSFFKNGEMNIEDIMGAELVYDTNSEYYKPYYRFFIELETEITDKTVYGDLYVPAIEGKYIDPSSLVPDFTGQALEAFEAETITLPDGSEVSKAEAKSSYMTEGVPVLEFNFAFMRYAEPISYNTVDDPDCFDFEAKKFKNVEKKEISSPEYFMVKNGDYLEKAQMTVNNPTYRVAWENGEVKCLSCSAELRGAGNLSGIVVCEEPEEQSIDRTKLLYLYADPVDRGRTLPVIYNIDGKAKPNELILEYDAILCDGVKTFLDYANEDYAVMLGYDGLLEGTKAARASMEGIDVIYYRSDVNGVYVSADRDGWGIMKKPESADITKDKEYDVVGLLTEFAVEPRRMEEEGAKRAKEFISAKLKEYGWKVTEKEFPVYPYKDVLSEPYNIMSEDSEVMGYRSNILAELPDFDENRPTLLLSAHYDTTDGNIGIIDNGSGTAFLISAAEMLSKAKLDFNLRLVFFDMEEYAMYGSKYYLENMSEEERKNIIADINFDMVGGNSEHLMIATSNGMESPLEIYLNDILNEKYGLSEKGGISDSGTFMHWQIPAVTFIDESLPHEARESEALLDYLSNEEFNDMLSDLALIISGFDAGKFEEIKKGNAETDYMGTERMGLLKDVYKRISSLSAMGFTPERFYSKAYDNGISSRLCCEYSGDGQEFLIETLSEITADEKNEAIMGIPSFEDCMAAASGDEILVDIFEGYRIIGNLDEGDLEKVWSYIRR